MKTYSSIHAEPDEKVENWHTVIDRVGKSELTNQQEIQFYENRAQDWITCACGNLCDAIPRYDLNSSSYLVPHYKGEPKDHDLKSLGCQFAEAWCNFEEDENRSPSDNLKYAENMREILANIEKRSGEILLEMGIIDESGREIKS